MPDEIVRDQSGRAKLGADVDGRPVEIVSRDTGAALATPNLTFGTEVVAGLPVTITLPAGATHAQVKRPGGPTLLLAAGTSYISHSDIGMPEDASQVRVRMRAVQIVSGEVAGRSRWRRRTLIWRRPGPTDPVVLPITTTGAVVVSTSGVVGSSINVTAWPTPSRPGPLDPEIWQYASADAVADLTPVATANFSQGMAVPNEPARWFEIVYQIADTAFGTTVRVRSARFDIGEEVNTGPIEQADLTWQNSWITVNGLRQLVHAEFTPAGVTSSNEVQWRINCQRYVTGWVDCPVVSGNRRTFGDILCPTGHPHQGMKLNEFMPWLQDMFAVELRWRVTPGSGAWSAIDPGADDDAAWLRVPLPAGAGLQFNSSPTTIAQIQTAINAGFASSSLYVIGLPAGATLSHNGSSLQFSDKIKAGAPLVITATDRSNPTNFNGFAGRLWQFTRCENFILDRFNIHNNVTQNVGAPPRAAFRDVPDGNSLSFFGVRRSYVQNISFRDHDVGFEMRDADDIYFGFCRLEGTYQDGWRIYRRGSNILIEGEDSLAPDIYPDLIDAPGYSPLYHPDVMQVSTATATSSNWYWPVGNRLGGVRNVRRVRGRSYAPADGQGRYNAGHFGADVLVNQTYVPGDPEFSRYINENITYEGMFIRTNWNLGVGVYFCDGFTIRNSVIRRNIPYGRNDNGPNAFQLLNWARNVTVSNVVSYANYYADNRNLSGMTQAQIQAQVTGSVTVHASNWPSGWTGGEDRYYYGPDAYRA